MRSQNSTVQYQSRHYEMAYFLDVEFPTSLVVGVKIKAESYGAEKSSFLFLSILSDSRVLWTPLWVLPGTFYKQSHGLQPHRNLQAVVSKVTIPSVFGTPFFRLQSLIDTSTPFTPQRSMIAVVYFPDHRALWALWPYRAAEPYRRRGMPPATW